MGIAIWSPRLDPQGNSYRGIKFLERLTERFSLSIFDQLMSTTTTKVDPTVRALRRTSTDNLGSAPSPPDAATVPSTTAADRKAMHDSDDAMVSAEQSMKAASLDNVAHHHGGDRAPGPSEG